MLDKVKSQFNQRMLDNDVETFGYIVDKKTNKLICVNDINTFNSSAVTSPDSHEIFNLDEVVQQHYEYNNTIDGLKKTISIDKVVLACAQTLLEKNSFDVSINNLLAILCDFYGGEFACLFERDYSTNMTNVNYKFHKEHISLINKKYTKSFKISADDTWTKYLREHDYAFLQTSTDIDDTLVESSYYKRFMESTRNNLLVVSLNDNDVILGGIEIDNITKNIENVDLIKTIAAFIVNNLHIKNSNNELQQQYGELENKNTLNQIMLECAKTLVYDDDDVDACMNELLEIINNYYGSDITNIYHTKANSDILLPQYTFAISKEVLSRRIKELSLQQVLDLYKDFDIGGVGYVSSVREMSDLLENTFPNSYDILKEKKINSLLFVPLVSQGKTVGFLEVENPKRNTNEALLLTSMSTFVINYIKKNDLLLKLEKLSYTDNLTGVYNRNFYNNYLDDYKNNPKKQKSIGVIFSDVNGLKKANDNFGHELGDKLIKWSANFLLQNIDGLNFRIGGDEFISIIENVTQEKFESIVQDLKERINSYGEVHISLGKAWSDNTTDLESTITSADEDMYVQKKEYYRVLSSDERTVRNYLEEFKQSILALEIDA